MKSPKGWESIESWYWWNFMLIFHRFIFFSLLFFWIFYYALFCLRATQIERQTDFDSVTAFFVWHFFSIVCTVVVVSIAILHMFELYFGTDCCFSLALSPSCLSSLKWNTSFFTRDVSQALVNSMLFKSICNITLSDAQQEWIYCNETSTSMTRLNNVMSLRMCSFFSLLSSFFPFCHFFFSLVIFGCCRRRLHMSFS